MEKSQIIEEYPTELSQNDARELETLLIRADKYAAKQGWSITGMEVFYRLFAGKYHWTPSQVRSLTFEEMWILSADEFDTPSKKRKGVI